jgi:hypothetical protein
MDHPKVNSSNGNPPTKGHHQRNDSEMLLNRKSFVGKAKHISQSNNSSYLVKVKLK